MRLGGVTGKLAVLVACGRERTKRRPQKYSYQQRCQVQVSISLSKAKGVEEENQSRKARSFSRESEGGRSAETLIFPWHTISLGTRQRFSPAHEGPSTRAD